MSLGEQFEPVLAAARQGADWTLASLYRDLHPRVLRCLWVRDPSEAEDLAAETWLDVARGLLRFDGDEAGFRAGSSPSPGAGSSMNAEARPGG